jgi:hypothetical protein
MEFVCCLALGQRAKKARAQRKHLKNNTLFLVVSSQENTSSKRADDWNFLIVASVKRQRTIGGEGSNYLTLSKEIFVAD